MKNSQIKVWRCNAVQLAEAARSATNDEDRRTFAVSALDVLQHARRLELIEEADKAIADPKTPKWVVEGELRQLLRELRASYGNHNSISPSPQAEMITEFECTLLDRLRERVGFVPAPNPVNPSIGGLSE